MQQNFLFIYLFIYLLFFLLLDVVDSDASDFFPSFVPCIAQLTPDNEIRKTLLKNHSLIVLCWNEKKVHQKSHYTKTWFDQV